MYCFAGGDKRAFWTVDYLRNRGLVLSAYGVPGWEDRPLPEHIELLLLPFPLPGSWMGISVLADRLTPGALVVGGRLGKTGALLEATGARVRDLYGTEPLTTLNAVATAEGALALLVKESEITLWESRCLVIGGGRIGTLLGERLRALGAEVTVAVRSPKDRAMVRGRGMLPERTGSYDRGLEAYDFVINTVPAPVLNGEHLTRLKKNCVLLELASAPGGFSPETCGELGLKAIQAPGLPGRFSPKTAGILYGESLWEILKEEGMV